MSYQMGWLAGMRHCISRGTNFAMRYHARCWKVEGNSVYLTGYQNAIVSVMTRKLRKPPKV